MTHGFPPAENNSIDYDFRYGMREHVAKKMLALELVGASQKVPGDIPLQDFAPFLVEHLPKSRLESYAVELVNNKRSGLGVFRVLLE